jgi:hypothetical protein
MEGAQSGPKTLKTWELRGKVVVVDMGGKYDVNTVRSFFQSKGAKVLFELKEHADMYVTDMNEREETQSRITRSASLRSRALLSKSNPQVSGDRPKSKTEIEQYLAKYRIMLCYYNRLRPHIERFLNSSSLHSFGHGNRMVCIRDRRSVYNPVIKQYCPSNDENVSSNLSGKKRARTEAPDVPDCFETARKHAKNIKDYSKVSRTPRIRDGPKSGYCELCFKRFDNLTEVRSLLVPSLDLS